MREMLQKINIIFYHDRLTPIVREVHSIDGQFKKHVKEMGKSVSSSCDYFIFMLSCYG